MHLNVVGNVFFLQHTVKWKTLVNGQNDELAKKLWRISEIVCRQVKFWQFLGDTVSSMQANELRIFTVTLTANQAWGEVHVKVLK